MLPLFKTELLIYKFINSTYNLQNIKPNGKIYKTIKLRFVPPSICRVTDMEGGSWETVKKNQNYPMACECQNLFVQLLIY